MSNRKLSLSSAMKLKFDQSKNESLLGNKGTLTHTTYATAMTLRNVLHAIRILICVVEFFLYIIMIILYLSEPQSTVDSKPLFDSHINLTYLEAYYWIQIVVQSTVIMICMQFYVEFILYTDTEWIGYVKELKKENKVKVAFVQYKQNPDEDSKHSQGVHIEVRKRKKRKNKKRIKIIDWIVCCKVCSFNFFCRRIGAAIRNIMTLSWSEMHILCMLACIYYLLSMMLRIWTNKNNKDNLLFAISDGLSAFGIILPPIAYGFCLRLKNIYDRRHSFDDETFHGSQFEESRGYFNTTEMSIVQASKSVLNDKMIKVWMFVMYLLQLFAFIIEPIASPDKFREFYINEMYDCQEIKDSEYEYECKSFTASQVVFVLHVLLFRLAVPSLLLNVAFSFTPKSSNSAQIITYKGFHQIVTPTAIIIIVIFSFLSSYFLFNNYTQITFIYVGGIILFSIWQIWLFIRLLTLAEEAETDQEQFYGFAKQTNASLFNYFSKGILLMLLWAISFVCLLYFHGDNDGDIDDLEEKRIYRQIPTLIFAVMSMFLLVPLQKVAISPTYNDYFVRKQKKKYLVTFHIICFLSACFMVQKLILVASFYFDILTNGENMKSSAYATSFSLSFASICFFIWLFGKYSGILYPSMSRISSNKSGRSPHNKSHTEMDLIDDCGKHDDDHYISPRKDSRMSLTELYNQQHHQRSIPIAKPSISGDFSDIGGELARISSDPDGLKIQRTKSLSIRTSNNLSLNKDKNNKNDKPALSNSMSRSKIKKLKMKAAHYDIRRGTESFDNYDKVASKYGMRNVNHKTSFDGHDDHDDDYQHQPQSPHSQD